MIIILLKPKYTVFRICKPATLQYILYLLDSPWYFVTIEEELKQKAGHRSLRLFKRQNFFNFLAALAVLS